MKPTFISFFALFLSACVPQTSLPPAPVPQASLAEEDDFPRVVDDAEVPSVVAAGGIVTGTIGAPAPGETDRDVVRVVGTPGTLLRLSLQGAEGSPLLPAAFLVSRRGEVVQLQREASVLALEALFPREGELFAVVDDARNLDGEARGGDNFTYQLSTAQEAPAPLSLGPINRGETLRTLREVPAGGMAFFSFSAPPGLPLQLLLLGQDEARPVGVIYTPSFDEGLSLGTGETNPEAFFLVQGARETLLGVSEFGGAGGGISLTLSAP